MTVYSVTVVRADGRLHPVALTAQEDFDAVIRQALAKAQDLAVNGCPLGDKTPPRAVEIREEGAALILRIAIDPSLRPG